MQGGDALSDCTMQLDRAQSFQEVLAVVRSHDGVALTAEVLTGALASLRRIEASQPNNTEALIDALGQIVVRFHFDGRHTAFALVASAWTVERARMINALPQLRRALMLHGLVLGAGGRMSEAIDALEEALRIAQTLGDPAAECSVSNNMACAFFDAAMYRDAVAYLDRTIALADGPAKMPALSSIARANLALCLLHLEDRTRALHVVKEALALIGDPTTAETAVLACQAEATHVRLLLWQRRIVEARAAVERIRALLPRANSARAAVFLGMAQGLLEVVDGRQDLGLSRLSRTLAEARAARVEERETLASLVQAHELAGEPELALKFLNELSTLLRQQPTAARATLPQQQLVGLVGKEPQYPLHLIDAKAEGLRGQIATREAARIKREVFERLAVMAEAHDDPTGLHSYRTGRLARLLAEALGLPETTLRNLEVAARLHDIGKSAVPQAILLKPAALDEHERAVMRLHVEHGARMLENSTIAELEMAREIALSHHEWWNGSGYPHGAAGESIPLLARIVAIADAFDALTHARPHRPASSVDNALATLQGLAGSQFDPTLTATFCDTMRHLAAAQGDLEAYLTQGVAGTAWAHAGARLQALRNGGAAPVGD